MRQIAGLASTVPAVTRKVRREWDMDVNASWFLASRPEKNLVHIDILRLADCEGNRIRERLGRNRNFL
jgi:hypothetical protein